MTDTKSYRDLEKFESGRLCIFRLPLGKTKKTELSRSLFDTRRNQLRAPFAEDRGSR